ncbi:MAG: hypothetical protein NC417_05550 [Candidatus Gastranaerophilales bacterium]|nr:hypothetical protein [Candidatus Gastranaerophilales bacterium]
MALTKYKLGELIEQKNKQNFDNEYTLDDVKGISIKKSFIETKADMLGVALNSYILHRIVNDRDQEMVKRLVPDTLGKLLDELPSLPTKKAIVLGAAVPIPTVVDIKELPKEKRPKSENPEFGDVWSGKCCRPLDWKEVVDEWI